MLAPSSIALGLLAALWGTFGAAARQDATAMILAFVVGAILIGLGAGISPSEPEEAAPEPPRRIPLFSFAAAATAGILLLVALRGVGGYAPGPRRAWALYVASLFFLVAAAWPFPARPRLAPRRVSR